MKFTKNVYCCGLSVSFKCIFQEKYQQWQVVLLYTKLFEV